MLPARFRQVQIGFEPNGGRHGLVDQIIEIGGSHHVQHRLQFILARSDVASHEFVLLLQVLESDGIGHGDYLCFLGVEAMLCGGDDQRRRPVLMMAQLRRRPGLRSVMATRDARGWRRWSVYVVLGVNRALGVCYDQQSC